MSIYIYRQVNKKMVHEAKHAIIFTVESNLSQLDAWLVIIGSQYINIIPQKLTRKTNDDEAYNKPSGLTNQLFQRR